MDALQEVGGGDVGHVEGRVLTHQDCIHRTEVQFPRFPEGKMRAALALHRVPASRCLLAGFGDIDRHRVIGVARRDAA